MHSDITLRPITNDDLDFLAHVYASTRQEEMAQTGWPRETIDSFLRMQFDLQHQQYTRNYTNADFALILKTNHPIGRLYVHRQPHDIRIMDISLLTPYRRRGIGGSLLTDLINEAQRKSVKLSLHVECNNPILPYYQQRGWQIKEQVGIYYYMEKLPRKEKIAGQVKECV